MNDHVHFLVWRSKYTIEYLVNQLKGAGTLALELSQTPWTRKCWKIFIDDEISFGPRRNTSQPTPNGRADGRNNGLL